MYCIIQSQICSPLDSMKSRMKKFASNKIQGNARQKANIYFCRDYFKIGWRGMLTGNLGPVIITSASTAAEMEKIYVCRTGLGPHIIENILS